MHKAFLILVFVALTFLLSRSDVLLGRIWRTFIAEAVVKSAEAADLPLCKVSLASLSKTSGAPGDDFEMYGEWEDTQGAKSAAINMGSGNKLEILSWTSKTLRVRIPKRLRPGAYKVGVYCNNPPHWQGSGFKDFMVTAPTPEDVENSGGALPAAESSTPLIEAPDGAVFQLDNDSAIPADANAPAPQQKAVHKEPVASPQPKNQAANFAGDIVDALTKTLSGILAELESRTGILYFAGAVALLLFLNYIFKPKTEKVMRINEKSRTNKQEQRGED